MSLEKYEQARKHWEQWASKISGEERKKYLLPEVPQHSVFLKQRFESLGSSLQGIIQQQAVTRNYRNNLTAEQKRDIIQRENVTEGFVPKVQEKTTALELHLAKRHIIYSVNRDEFKALETLNLEEAIKVEIKRLEKEKKEKEEKDKTANAEAIKAIESSIAELNTFLAQIPQMRGAIAEFASQQIREQLSQDSMSRVAKDGLVTLGSSAEAKLNQGLALSEKEKKERSSTMIQVRGRFYNGSLELTVSETKNPDGTTSDEFSIPSSCYARNKYGLPGSGYLFHAGRMDLAEAVHERLILKNKQDFDMDFSDIETRDLRWFVEYLRDSIEVSIRNADRQMELLRSDTDSPILSSHVIMHDAAVENLTDYLETHPWVAYALGETFVNDIKKLNNQCHQKKAVLLSMERNQLLADSVIRSPGDVFVAAKNKAHAGEQLTVAAYNEMAKVLDTVDLVGSDIGLAANAMGPLLAAQKTVEAAQEKAKALVDYAEEALKAQLDTHREKTPKMAKSAALKALEASVKSAKEKLLETEQALARLSQVNKTFHDAFSVTQAKGQSDIKTALGERDEALNLLAPLVAADDSSLEAVAKVLFEADKTIYATLEAAKDGFLGATQTEKIKLINVAYNANPADTMAALTKANRAPLDAGKVARVIVEGGLKAKAEVLINANRKAVATKMLTDYAESAYALAVKRRTDAIDKIKADPASAETIGKHEDTAKAVYREGELANKVAQVNRERTLRAILNSKDNAKVIGMKEITAIAISKDLDIAQRLLLIDIDYTVNALIEDNADRVAGIIYGFSERNKNEISQTINEQLSDSTLDGLKSALSESLKTKKGNNNIHSILKNIFQEQPEYFRSIGEEVCLKIVKQALQSWDTLPGDTQYDVMQYMLESERFESTFALVAPGCRIGIIKEALKDWGNVPVEVQSQIIEFILTDETRFSAMFPLATEEVKIAIVEAALNGHPADFHDLGSSVRESLLAEVINPSTDPVQAIVDEILFASHPIVISANASIDALTPIVEGNVELRNALEQILPEARDTDLTKILREALTHNPAATLSVLNQAYEILCKDPAATPEQIAVANPASVKEVLNNRNSGLTEFIKQGIQHCKPDILDARREIQPNVLALDLKEAHQQADKASRDDLKNQDEFYQQLRTNPKSFTVEADGSVVFGSPVITLTADQAREVVNQLAKDYAERFASIEAQNARVLKMGAATYELENAVNQGLAGRIEQDKENLQQVQTLLDSVRDELIQADEFYHQLRDTGSPLQRLFDSSVVKAQEKLDKLLAAKKGLYSVLPEAERDKGEEGAVKAAKDVKIPDDLVTREIIDDPSKMPTDKGSEIQRARARDYINLINADPAIKELRDKSLALTEDVVKLAKLRVFHNNDKVQDARVVAFLELAKDSANSGLQNVLTIKEGKGPEALRLLEEIAFGKYRGPEIAEASRKEAFKLLVKINTQSNVRQARNEALDQQPESQKAWKQFVESHADFKSKASDIQTAEQELKAAKIIAESVKRQLEDNTPLMAQLNEKRKMIEETQPSESKKYLDALSKKQQALPTSRFSAYNRDLAV